MTSICSGVGLSFSQQWSALHLHLEDFEALSDNLLTLRPVLTDSVDTNLLYPQVYLTFYCLSAQ